MDSLVLPMKSEVTQASDMNPKNEDNSVNEPDPNSFHDISSALFSQCNELAHGDVEENRVKRGRIPEHPCWDLMQRVAQHNYMICRMCSKVVMWPNTRNAMQHFRSVHPQVAEELEHSWQMKLQIRADVNRLAMDSSRIDSYKKRGRTTEHPSWLYFTRIDKKGANCKLCGVHVAYACSGNLMKHLKSRHVTEFVLTQKEWDDILRKKRQLCEMRMMATVYNPGEQSPSDLMPYEIGEEDQEEATTSAGLSQIDDEDGSLESMEKQAEKERDDILKQDVSHESNNSFPTSFTASVLNSRDQSSDLTETANKILQSIGLSQHNSTDSQSSSAGQECNFENRKSLSSGHSTLEAFMRAEIGKNAAFTRRINSFVNTLAEDLASFPLEKSLLCMRQIRKFMDERLLEVEGGIQNSEDDASIN